MTRLELQQITTHSARLAVRVKANGMECAIVPVLTGPRKDIEELIRGDIGWEEILKRWIVDEQYGRRHP